MIWWRCKCSTLIAWLGVLCVRWRCAAGGGASVGGGSVRHSRARSLSRQLASSRATPTFSPPRWAACHPVTGGRLCCEEDHGQTGGRRGGVEERWRWKSSWLEGWARRRGGCRYARLPHAGPWEWGWLLGDGLWARLGWRRPPPEQTAGDPAWWASSLIQRWSVSISYR